MNGYAGGTRTSAPITWTERTLECQGMPPEEIDSILATDDPEVVRRYLEVHREWRKNGSPIGSASSMLSSRSSSPNTAPRAAT
jgi:hypothetical protein